MSRCIAAIVVVGIFVASVDAQDKKIPNTGHVDAELACFDEVMLRFLEETQVPGAALAVAKDGKLVYSRGFGFADRERGFLVQPRTRFRIASISKPITAAAILWLVERGLLKLDDNPFTILDLALPETSDPRLGKITVRQLLQHTAGWDRAISFDPMFRPVLIAEDQRVDPPAKPIDVIRYMTKLKLDFDPGERYAYSNFGYCLLGRIIEKVGNMPYDEFVRKNILDPLGMEDTELGQTLATAKNEVRYYDEKGRTGTAVMGPNLGKDVPLPYGRWYLEAMDSHGGWISSAPDLVRFASALRDGKNCPILRPAMVHAMFARPDGLAGHSKNDKEKDLYYGCGWQVRVVGDGKINFFHNGALDGTATILVTRHDGLSWAVLFNSRANKKGTHLGTLIDPQIHQAANTVKNWPKRDRFERNPK